MLRFRVSALTAGKMKGTQKLLSCLCYYVSLPGGVLTSHPILPVHTAVKCHTRALAPSCLVYVLAESEKKNKPCMKPPASPCFWCCFYQAYFGVMRTAAVSSSNMFLLPYFASISCCAALVRPSSCWLFFMFRQTRNSRFPHVKNMAGSLSLSLLLLSSSTSCKQTAVSEFRRTGGRGRLLYYRHSTPHQP